MDSKRNDNQNADGSALFRNDSLTEEDMAANIANTNLELVEVQAAEAANSNVDGEEGNIENVDGQVAEMVTAENEETALIYDNGIVQSTVDIVDNGNLNATGGEDTDDRTTAFVINQPSTIESRGFNVINEDNLDDAQQLETQQVPMDDTEGTKTVVKPDNLLEVQMSSGSAAAEVVSYQYVEKQVDDGAADHNVILGNVHSSQLPTDEFINAAPPQEGTDTPHGQSEQNIEITNLISGLAKDVVDTDSAAAMMAVSGDTVNVTESKQSINTGQQTLSDESVEATVTVKFVLMPSGDVATVACLYNQSFSQLKEHFSAELKIPADLLIIMFEGKSIPDVMTLADLGIGPNGIIQLEVQSIDPINTPIKPYTPRLPQGLGATMPDIITVKIPLDPLNIKEVTIEVQKATIKKPFLGGFRHKDTKVEYHNASTMTYKKLRPVGPNERFSRDTQTVHLKHQLLQTRNNMSTQMTKIGCYVSNLEDKCVTPGKYTTADEIERRRLTKIIIIQKYYRRWLARKKVKLLRKMKADRLEWERQQELKKIKEKEDRISDEFNRRMNPKSKADFDLLYAALERWRLEEMKNINDTMTGPERKAALYMLMQQQIELIAAIGRHHNDATAENITKRIHEFLQKSSSPKRWNCAYDGKPIEVDTPYTLRARELKDIYNSINMRYLTQDERLDVLLTLKHTVKEHDCKLTQEIIQLIDREADLLMRGVKESNLEGLRKRISTLFLQYIKTPTFNPEAAPLLKVPQDPTNLRSNVRFCSSCNKYLHTVEFPLSTTTVKQSVCKHCKKVNNDGQARQDHSHYRYILQRLRKSENDIDKESRIAFLLQEDDIRYLVDKIWNSQSILSSWDDMFDLIMVRWDRRIEWSPWNCILLTRDEAEAHNELEELEHGYEPVFFHKVEQKHVLARNYFSRLPGMAEHVREKLNDRSLRNGPNVLGKNRPEHFIKA